MKKVIIEFVILESKWQLWKHRNNVKYGKHPVTPDLLIFDKIITECQLQANLILSSRKSVSLHPNILMMLQLL
jgi:hypothetical protein